MLAGTAAAAGADRADSRGWRPGSLFDCSGWEAIWEAQLGGVGWDEALEPTRRVGTRAERPGRIDDFSIHAVTMG